jgi:hypothetical protein
MMDCPQGHSSDHGIATHHWDTSLAISRRPNTPYRDSVNKSVSAVADPFGFDSDVIGPNDGFALLLVQDFHGEQGDDLDTNDNGLLDYYP